MVGLMGCYTHTAYLPPKRMKVTSNTSSEHLHNLNEPRPISILSLQV